MHLCVAYCDSKLAIIYTIQPSVSITFFLYSLSLHLGNRLHPVVYSVNIMYACMEWMNLMKVCLYHSFQHAHNVWVR